MSLKAKATIDLSAISHNLNIVKQAAPNTKIAAVVKADAYGHGILQTLRALQSADFFAVARIEEAIDLRLAGVLKPIVLLSGFINDDELAAVIQHDLQVVIHHTQQIQLLKHYHVSKPLTVWLKLDTGMHRLGLSAQEFEEAYQFLSTSQLINDIILMTHFASADELDNKKTSIQLTRFNETCEQLNKTHPCSTQRQYSTANSAAILAWPETHCNIVRPGLMLYGISPLNKKPDNPADLANKLIPTMTFESQIIAVKIISKGEPVGYGEAWISQRETTVGIIAIGYGDGYPRHASEGTPVLINGQRAPLIGRVSMDLITVDLTDHIDVKVGDQAMLWGKELSVAEIAEYSETIPYELLTGLTSRVQFVYSDEKSSR